MVLLLGPSTAALGPFPVPLGPTTALAADPPRTDPEVGTPAEAVYGIPLEEARRDAAPGIRPGTSIRTDNAVGSSSRVPGLAGAHAAGDDEEADPERLQERRRERRREAARAATRISGEPSRPATALLLVLVVGIAAAGGVGAGRLVGRRARL